MDFRKSCVLMWAGMIAGISLVVIGEGLGSRWLLGLGCLVFLAGPLQTRFFFRCPHCGGAWDIRGGIPAYCPKCGKKVR